MPDSEIMGGYNPQEYINWFKSLILKGYSKDEVYASMLKVYSHDAFLQSYNNALAQFQNRDLTPEELDVAATIEENIKSSWSNQTSFVLKVVIPNFEAWYLRAFSEANQEKNEVFSSPEYQQFSMSVQQLKSLASSGFKDIGRASSIMYDVANLYDSQRSKANPALSEKMSQGWLEAFNSLESIYQSASPVDQQAALSTMNNYRQQLNHIKLHAFPRG